MRSYARPGTASSSTAARIVGASDHTVTHSLYLLDPDGNELELYIDVPGVDWRTKPELLGSPVRPLRCCRWLGRSRRRRCRLRPRVARRAQLTAAARVTASVVTRCRPRVRGSSAAPDGPHEVGDLAFDAGADLAVGVLPFGGGLEAFGALQDRLTAVDADRAARRRGRATLPQRTGGAGRAEVGRAVAVGAAADGGGLPGRTGHGAGGQIDDEVVFAVAAVAVRRRRDLGDDLVAGLVQVADQCRAPRRPSRRRSTAGPRLPPPLVPVVRRRPRAGPPPRRRRRRWRG